MRLKAQLISCALLGIAASSVLPLGNRGTPKSDYGTPIDAGSKGGVFTDSRGRKYTKNEKGVIRRVKE